MAHSLGNYFLPLFIGARGMEFDWQYLRMGISANAHLVRTLHAPKLCQTLSSVSVTHSRPRTGDARVLCDVRVASQGQKKRGLGTHDAACLLRSGAASAAPALHRVRPQAAHAHLPPCHRVLVIVCWADRGPCRFSFIGIESTLDASAQLMWCCAYTAVMAAVTALATWLALSRQATKSSFPTPAYSYASANTGAWLLGGAKQCGAAAT